MTKYQVYRTKRGTLTFKESGESVYTVSAKSLAIAKQVLAHLKQVEKNKEDNAI
tara:strand:+ start:1433 stop:1594 length:162 start_codon:yes stop_codon:yes gene_type:complete